MVTKKPKGLGRGLDALLGPSLSVGTAEGSAPATPAGTPMMLALHELAPGQYQPRTRMDEGALYELAESIKSQGIMQPILVRRLGSNRPPTPTGQALTAPDLEAHYEIIAGERRFRAARLAGLTEVPVLVRDVPDQAVAVMALIENIQREDLNPLEEAQGVQRLISEFGLNREGAAQAIGRSASAVSNMLRLLNLVEPVQQMLTAGDLDMGHARALLSLDRARQITCAHEIVARKLSVRETERLVNRLHEDEAIRTGAASAAGRTPPPKSRDVLRLEEQLADLLAVPVEIRIRKRTKRGDQGELAISFGSLDDLGALLDRLGITER